MVRVQTTTRLRCSSIIMVSYTAASVALPSEATRRSRERAAAPKPLLGASRYCLNMPLVLDVEALLCVKNCLYLWFGLSLWTNSITWEGFPLCSVYRTYIESGMLLLTL